VGPLIACFDVHYQDDVAYAAAVLIEQWTDAEPVDQFLISCDGVEPYQPGSFYQRELRPLGELIQQLPETVDCFVIDAYCHLSADHDPGLGDYFHKLLPQGSVVVGVAKNRFHETTHAVEVLRGESQRPLFVTSIGIEYSLAADSIRLMAGRHRMPTILTAADRLCRSACA